MKPRTALLYALILSGALCAAPGFAANGNAAAGKAKAATCEVCHGAGGRGTAPNFPALAGQHQEYLEHALHQFKDGTRTSAIMNAQAAPLSSQDIADLAAFFAGLPCAAIRSRSRHRPRNSGG